MFMVDEETAAAIQNAFCEKGEWAAVVELRQHFKISDNAEALKAVRVIAGWRKPRMQADLTSGG
ncbi:hypothetical protein [Azospirillum thermophilum]|uniref:Uncharacterized protein n=1 Tax=Azospirillum thermophilum TaxID=2202148 RepID=A0A2S2CWD6_9PROT|nr:hypothetical protein [Azospirillum thermophilum]AWK88843.1 hypothetical protein DEW08_22510 [Azospirillum thermophilum]